ncbi:Uncharacterised protein [Rhodococcus wratislaviensis]|uniref:Secreted protein n=1 Tax=Rhodococcus wratislaviensis TaxID=44752 RepID=A0AB38FCC5_RHOWR|nr:Uncharacterised protein [Rhodococcus wratislaviensis]
MPYWPFSSRPFVPSVWVCSTVSSSDIPGMNPTILFVVTSAMSASSTIVPTPDAPARLFSSAPVSRSTYKLGNSRNTPSYGKYWPVAQCWFRSKTPIEPIAPASFSSFNRSGTPLNHGRL